jgi:hypothetical protein
MGGGGRGRGGATSYDGEEAWFFIDHLILSASTKIAKREINVWF